MLEPNILAKKYSPFHPKSTGKKSDVTFFTIFNNNYFIRELWWMLMLASKWPIVKYSIIEIKTKINYRFIKSSVLIISFYL